MRSARHLKTTSLILMGSLLTAMGLLQAAATTPDSRPLVTVNDLAKKQIVRHFVYVDGNSPGAVKIPLAIGSGLVTLATEGDSTIVVALADRGPNVGVEEIPAGGSPRVIFPLPDFVPVFAPLTVKNFQISSPLASELDHTPLRGTPSGMVGIADVNGAASSGLPTMPSHEVAVNLSLSEIRHPQGPTLGIDPEAITFDLKRNLLWIAEEYSPSILAVSPSTGRVVDKRVPGTGLPELLRNRAPNRGFEALTYISSDELVALLQSPLRDPASNLPESFVRMVFISPSSSSLTAPRTMAVPLPPSAKPESYKLGEVVSLSNTLFLAFEAYESRDDEKHYHIILLDTSRAKEIDSEQFIDDASKITGPVQKKIVLDFKDLDWASGKIEGLAVINPKTLLISKDNDFGIKLAKNKKAKDTVPKVTFKDVPTEFLFVELRKPILEYLPVM